MGGLLGLWEKPLSLGGTQKPPRDTFSAGTGVILREKSLPRKKPAPPRKYTSGFSRHNTPGSWWGVTPPPAKFEEGGGVLSHPVFFSIN